jgi:sortase A
MKPTVVLHWLERGLLLTGLALSAFWLYAYCDAQAYQSQRSRQLEARRSLNVIDDPEGKRPIRSASEASLARIEIPRLRISAMIDEGTSASVLDRAVGRVVYTSRPGEPGNMGLAAHRESYFRGLGGIQKNDLIRVRTARADYVYRVQWAAIVQPDRVDVLDPTEKPSLTLVTCFPFQWVGPAPMRFVVRAIEVSSPA